ncbi:hypothetical protein P4O66_011197 [Electrophorus voltai]|uniref:Uncharacterized protein n=1 Tax=Electrophorus voltai TaxID=2609070 RepID=A0AAD8Z744_9TELE|nr:hypothetical protein P4O66_011197 [Electrophorus voltai]
MEVEEVPHRVLPSPSDATGSKKDEPPAPKAPPRAPPRARHPEASKLPWVTCREASPTEEDTPPPKVKSPRAHAPTPKPRRGKKGSSTSAFTGKVQYSWCASRRTYAKTRTAAATQAGEGQSSPGWSVSNPADDWGTGWGSFSLFQTVYQPYVWCCALCIAVSVVVLVPVLPPAVLLALPHGRLSSPLALPFGVGLGAAAR